MVLQFIIPNECTCSKNIKWKYLQFVLCVKNTWWNDECHEKLRVKSKTYTARWAGRGSWSQSAEPGGGRRRSECVPGCDGWAATGSAPACWWCRWPRRRAALRTGQTDWTPRTLRPGAAPVQRYRWPPLFRCRHRAERSSLQTRRLLAPLRINKSGRSIVD